MKVVEVVVENSPLNTSTSRVSFKEFKEKESASSSPFFGSCLPSMPKIKSTHLSFYTGKVMAPTPLFIAPLNRIKCQGSSPFSSSSSSSLRESPLPPPQIEDDDDDDHSPIIKRRKLVRKSDLARPPSPDPLLDSSSKSTKQEVIEILSSPEKVILEAESPVEHEIMDFLNSAAEGDLVDCLNCSAEQAQSIISLRPLLTFNLWLETCENSVSRLIKKYRDILLDLGSVDSIIKLCEFTGKEIKKIMNGWQKYRVTGLKEDLHSIYEIFLTQPPCVNPKLTLKGYQLLGISWLVMLYDKRLGGILADEMGLGKTAQVICFLGTLLESGRSNGPHLIVVPSSTLDNWMREIKQWCPNLNAIAYSGAQPERAALQYDIMENASLHIVVTTYTICTGNSDDRRFLRSRGFKTLILDEGHMIKNGDSQRAKHLRNLKISFKLLITGTPLQNNLMELLSLLTFIMPNIFEPARESFEAIFDLKKASNQKLDDEVSKRRLDHAGKILSPFVLRRKKDDV
jgi:hypothetical protein